MSPTPSTTKGSAKAKKPRKAGISPVYTRRIALKADAELIGSSTYAALERLNHHSIEFERKIGIDIELTLCDSWFNQGHTSFGRISFNASEHHKEGHGQAMPKADRFLLFVR